MKIVENANTKKLENLYLRSSIFILSKIELPHFEGFGIVNFRGNKIWPSLLFQKNLARWMLNYFKKKLNRLIQTPK